MNVIDLAGNHLNEYALKSIVKLALIPNSDILVFDARSNPGYTDKNRRQLALVMLKNIEKKRLLGVEIKKEHLVPDLYSYGVDTEILARLRLKDAN